MTYLRPSVRRRSIGVLVILALVATIIVTTVSASDRASAATVLPAPTGITATRDTTNPKNFTVAWKAVTGTDHYNVSVFYASTDHVMIVPGSATKLAVTGVDYTTQYRITVSTRAKDGTGSTSGYIWLNPAVPGAATKVLVTRDPAGANVSASWAAPTWPGYQGTTGYRVVVTRMSDGVNVSDTTVKPTVTTFAMGGLDPTRSYSVKIAAVNPYGSGPVATTLVGSNLPNSPTATSAIRDLADPSVVHVTWAAPAFTGASPLTRYEMVTVDNGVTTTVTVAGTDTKADTKILNTNSGNVGVRACNTQGCSYLGTKANVVPAGTIVPVGDATSTNPVVAITQATDGVITVETTGVVGSTAAYPRLYVEVKPTLANGGFADFQWGQNGATKMVFQTVPTGTYDTVVYGADDAGNRKELARKVIVTGGDGTMADGDWEVVMGKADIRNNRIDMPYSGENRVLSLAPRSSQDMVLTTTATLQSGWGYGIWFRTSNDAEGISGFSFQYDPMWNDHFIIRQWYKGSECSTPIANTPFPSRMVVNAAHRITVVAKGDSVFATTDGMEVFRLDSLSAAVAKSPCHYPMPAGTRIGFRTWATTSASFVGTFTGTTLTH